jgi:23S rRNA (guanosine2251-2'-O)-methyltransferase
MLSKMREIIVVAHNMRSAHNVGSLLRTAEGIGVATVILSGYSPYPKDTNDKRLPYLAERINNRISKTALGAELTQPWQYIEKIQPYLSAAQAQGYILVALEQHARAIPLPSFNAADKLILLLGEEVTGIDPALLAMSDIIVEIPMFGSKESFNVVQAAAMALYKLRYVSTASL